MAELLSGVAEIFGLPSLALSLSTMPAAEMEKGAKRRNEKIARKIINLQEKESCVWRAGVRASEPECGVRCAAFLGVVRKGG